MIAAIRLRGAVKAPQKMKDTLEMLKLTKVYNCRVLPETEDYKGMLKKVDGYLTWGEVNEETLDKLIEKRGKDIDTENMEEKGIPQKLRLHPPKGGFKGSKKKHYGKKGELGYRGEEINKLLQKMI